MSKPLQTAEFEWMADDEIDDWKHLSCILDVDLEYPKDLHNLHNDYPFASERSKMGSVEKLITHFKNKTNCVVHCENLKLYESLGLKMKRFVVVLN